MELKNIRAITIQRNLKRGLLRGPKDAQYFYFWPTLVKITFPILIGSSCFYSVEQTRPKWFTSWAQEVHVYLIVNVTMFSRNLGNCMFFWRNASLHRSLRIWKGTYDHAIQPHNRQRQMKRGGLFRCMPQPTLIFPRAILYYRDPLKDILATIQTSM